MLIDYLNINPGDQLPHKFNVVVEIPKDGTHKYEFNKELGAFTLDRPLYTSVHYPGDYGFIPQTLADDGDALDVLIKIDKGTFPGCIVNVRPIGMLKLLDKGVCDYKILAVPTSDPRTADTQSIRDLSNHFMDEVDHFFRVYKELEGKDTCTDGWLGRRDAEVAIMNARENWEKNNEANRG